jgi:hypothetical protein
MPIKRDGKTYLTAEELDARLSERAQKRAKEIAQEISDHHKNQAEQYV